MRLFRIWPVALLWVIPAGAGDLVLSVPLEPARAAGVYAGMSGRVKRVAVQEGDRVAVGDTLVLLEDGALRLSEAAEGAAFRRLHAQLQRAERMRARGLISAERLESTHYEAEAARIRWERAQLDLTRAVVRSPMGGLVAECGVRAEEMVAPRMQLFQIIDPEDLNADLFVPADRLQGVWLGQAVTARPVLLPERAIRGRIVQVSPVIDPKSGTCRAVALFPGAGKFIRPGMVARVTIGKVQEE